MHGVSYISSNGRRVLNHRGHKTDVNCRFSDPKTEWGFIKSRDFYKSFISYYKMSRWYFALCFLGGYIVISKSISCYFQTSRVYKNLCKSHVPSDV